MAEPNTASGPSGTVGEIHLRAANLMRGYHRLPGHAGFRDGLFEVLDELQGVLHLDLQIGRKAPVPQTHPAARSRNQSVQQQERSIGPIAEEGEPLGMLHNAVELIAVGHQIAPAICRFMDGVARDDDRHLADEGGDEAAGIREFRFEAQVIPRRALEDAPLLLAIDLFVLVDPVRDARRALRRLLLPGQRVVGLRRLRHEGRRAQRGGRPQVGHGFDQRQLNLLGGNRSARSVVQRLQQTDRTFGLRLADFDAERFVAAGDRHVERRFDVAQMRIQRAAQVGQPGVVGRRK